MKLKFGAVLLAGILIFGIGSSVHEANEAPPLPMEKVANEAPPLPLKITVG